MNRRHFCIGLASLAVLARGQAWAINLRPKHPGETLTLGGRKVSLWRPTGSNAPLIIFSHGFHGGSKQSTFLMHTLAQAGYLVVAPVHADAGPSGKPQQPFNAPAQWSESTFRDRREDVLAVARALHEDPAWKNLIDWNQVGLAGHSLGGYTVLGMAGAWPGWKAKNLQIKAVLALSPYVLPYLDHGHLAQMDTPVMYQGGTIDNGITPSVRRPGGAYDKSSNPAYYVEFQGAGHMAWTDLNPMFQGDVNDYSLAFFNRYLKSDESADLTSKRGRAIDFRHK